MAYNWFLLIFFNYLINYVSSSKVNYVVYNIDDGLIDLNEKTFKSHLNEKTVAWAKFANEINQTGWSFLEIHTSDSFSDTYQAYYAGLVEGHVTRELIKMHWKNTVGDYCKNQESYCDRLKNFLNINYNSIKNAVERSRDKCSYWHNVGLTVEQLAGLDDGFNNKTNLKPHMNIDVFGLNLMNIFGDVEDLEVILNKGSNLRRDHLLGTGSCSGLIKLLADHSDLYVSQVSWNDYESMLRIIKYYNFKFHLTNNKEDSFAPGNKVTFSSYPGILQSGDDFYTLSSGLVTMETTISNNNKELYKSIKPDEVVLEWIRAITANRLAKTGPEWAMIFSKNNSGTYNNQWMVIDFKYFEPYNKNLKRGLLTVLEQLPTFIDWSDLTHLLNEQKYFPSYNVPYFKSVFNLSGNEETYLKYGDLFSYDKNPRANIFRRDHNKVIDIDSMIRLMRYNNYKNDPLSACNCTPPYSAENAISARSDLNPIDGKYPFQYLGHRPHGGIDMKLTTGQFVGHLKFFAISGPTYDDVPVFKWSESDFNEKLSHIGHPDAWKFPVVTTKFNTND